MLNDNRIRLSPSRSPMRNCVQRSLHSISRQPRLIVMVDAHPPETNRLKLLLKFMVNTVSGSLSLVDKRDSHFVTIVVFPNIVTKIFY